MTEILNENLLKSDFTFGFELEACVEGSYYEDYSFDDEDGEYDLPTSADDGVNGELAKAIDNNLNNLLNKGVPSKLHKYGNIDNDPSIRTYDRDDFSFEWASPVLQCTPYNFNRVIKMLSNLPTINVYTNDTCGFHHHLSYEGITERDMIWIYVNLCMDAEFRSFMKEVDGIELTSEEWSPDDALIDIKEAIQDNNYERVLRYLSDDKYRLFRIHPYGTIEWRGPRDFLNDNNLTIIKDFYKKFNTYISKVIEYQARKTIVDTNISKEEFFKQLTIAKENNPNEDRELEFLVRTHGYHDRPLEYKTERGATISKRLLNAMTINPELFYNFVLENKKGLIPIIRQETYIIQNIINKLYAMGVASPEEFTKSLFEMLTASFSDYDKVMSLLGNFSKFINNDFYLESINKNLNNGDYSAVKNMIKSAIRNNLNLPFNIFYNSLVNIIYNTQSDDLLYNGWLIKTLNYGHTMEYTLEQMIKLILFYVKMGFRTGIRPFTDNNRILNYVLQLDDENIKKWNNRLIAGLFEKPNLTWLATIIANHESLDIKGLIALCSRYENIFNMLEYEIRNKIEMYIRD